MKYQIEIKTTPCIPLAFPTEDDLAAMTPETRKEWEKIGQTEVRDELGKEYVFAMVTDFEGLQVEPEPDGPFKHLITQQRIALRSAYYEPSFENQFKVLMEVLGTIRDSIHEHEKTKENQKA